MNRDNMNNFNFESGKVRLTLRKSADTKGDCPISKNQYFLRKKFGPNPYPLRYPISQGHPTYKTKAFFADALPSLLPRLRAKTRTPKRFCRASAAATCFLWFTVCTWAHALCGRPDKLKLKQCTPRSHR